MAVLALHLGFGSAVVLFLVCVSLSLVWEGPNRAEALRPSLASGLHLWESEADANEYPGSRNFSGDGSLNDVATLEDGDDEDDDVNDMPSFVQKKNKDDAKDYDNVVRAAARIAKLDPEETLGRWRAEQERGTEATDFMDKILGTKNVKVTDEERQRIKPFAQQQHLDADQTIALWKKFKKEHHSIESFIGHVKQRAPNVKSSGERDTEQNKSWGETIGDAVDYAGDKIAEGWNSLVARFTSPQSNEAAAEAAARTAAERGDNEGAAEAARHRPTGHSTEEKLHGHDANHTLSCSCKKVHAKPHSE